MTGTVSARILFLAIITIVSLVGVVFPFCTIKHFGSQVATTEWFLLLQCFATGLVCGVALLHVLADAQEYLEKVSDFPVANAVALFVFFLMVGLNRMTVLLVKSLQDVNRNGKAKDVGLPGEPLGLPGEPLVGNSASPVSVNQGHVHQHLLTDPSISNDMASLWKAYLLELAIAVHSVLVGLGLGIATDSVQAVVTLGVALSFHQFFEGVALGMVGARAGLKTRGVWVMILMFTLSCPCGTALGLWLESRLDGGSVTDWTLGVLNALAAGALLEIGCVELLPEVFGHAHDGKVARYSTELTRLFSLFTGGAVMVVLAFWA